VDIPSIRTGSTTRRDWPTTRRVQAHLKDVKADLKVRLYEPPALV